jgi:hypothetical protein
LLLDANAQVPYDRGNGFELSLIRLCDLALLFFKLMETFTLVRHLQSAQTESSDGQDKQCAHEPVTGSRSGRQRCGDKLIGHAGSGQVWEEGEQRVEVLDEPDRVRAQRSF